MADVQSVEIPMRALWELLRVQLDAGGEAALRVTGSSMVPMLSSRRDQVWLLDLKK